LIKKKRVVGTQTRGEGLKTAYRTSNNLKSKGEEEKRERMALDGEREKRVL